MTVQGTMVHRILKGATIYWFCLALQKQARHWRNKIFLFTFTFYLITQSSNAKTIFFSKNKIVHYPIVFYVPLWPPFLIRLLQHTLFLLSFLSVFSCKRDKVFLGLGQNISFFLSQRRSNRSCVLLLVRSLKKKGKRAVIKFPYSEWKSIG